MQDKREIPAIVNKKIVIKCQNFHTLGGGTSLLMALGNRRMNRSAWPTQFFKKTNMSLGLVLMEELFTQILMHTHTPQSDAMSDDLSAS